MKTKYRIKKETQASSDAKFIVQYKWMMFGFIPMWMHCTIKYNIEDATEYIETRKGWEIIKIEYIY